MTAPHKLPSDADLWDRYSGLPAGAKLVLRLKSLMFLPTNKTAFLECLSRSGLRAPDGKAWSSSSVNVVLEELQSQRLLTEDLACPPALLHPVAADAAASAESDVLAAWPPQTIRVGPACTRPAGRRSRAPDRRHL